MVNIYDTANQMATELAEVEQVKELSAVFEKLRADQKAYDVFNEVQNLQFELQQKQASGEEITEEDIKKMQGYTEEFGKYPVINELMDSEKKINDLINELNQIITKPIAEIYQGK